MKKILLLLILAVAGLLPLRADEKELGFCGDSKQALMTNSSAIIIGQAIKVKGSLLAPFKGCQIVSVSIPNGQFDPDEKNPVSIWNMSVFVAKHPNDTKPLSTVRVKMDLEHPKEWVSYELKNPVDITDELGDVYIGMKSSNVKGVYPLNINKEAGDTAVNYVGIKYDDDPACVWSDCGKIYGQIMVRFTIRGESLPMDNLSLKSVVCPSFLTPGQPFEVTCTVTNTGCNGVADAELVYTIGNSDTQKVQMVFDNPLSNFNDALKYSFTAVCPDIEGSAPVKATLSKANGNVNSSASASVTRNSIAVPYEKLYDRNVVLEEYTGLACGNCPIGIEAIRRMMEAYDDGTFIPIAIHSSAMGPEILVSDSYHNPFVSLYNPSGGAPFSIMNRTGSGFYPRIGNIADAYEEHRSARAPVRINLTGIQYDKDKNRYYFDTETEFCVGVDNLDYAIALAITENGVGPATQVNYFSGMNIEEAGEWNKLEPYVQVYLNHVARDINLLIGSDNSMPVKAEAGQIYTYTGSVNGRNVIDPDKCRAVAMVIDRESGVIINAVTSTFAELGLPSGIETVTAAGIGDGMLYDLTGRRVSNPAPGVYIRNGQKTLIR